MSITLLCVAAPVMSYQEKSRDEAISLTSAEILRIRTPLNHRTFQSSICSQQAHDVAKLLILYNFRLGVMICCLGNTYTSNFLDFVSIDTCLLDISDIPVDPGEPPHNFLDKQHLLHQHTPFKASFFSSIQYMLFKKRYKNYFASNPYLSFINKNFSTNIQKSYSIVLSCWTLRFFRGIFFDTLGYNTCNHTEKVKGIQVNDPSGLLLGPNDSMDLNLHIDIEDPVAMPPVH